MFPYSPKCTRPLMCNATMHPTTPSIGYHVTISTMGFSLINVDGNPVPLMGILVSMDRNSGFHNGNSTWV